MKMFAPTLLLLLIAALHEEVRAYPNYAQLMPNGKNVRFQGESWPAVGHSRSFGGGPANAFGMDFARAGNRWTKEFCEKDSDGDGRSNGEELQDPNCNWKLGDADPGIKSLVTHPGIPDEAAVVECSEEKNSPAPSPSSNNNAYKIAIIGRGMLAQAIRNALLDAGLARGKDVVFAVREVDNADADGTEMDISSAVQQSTIVFLAMPANAVEDVVHSAGGANVLSQRIVIDCTNPFIWDKGPVWRAPLGNSVLDQLASLGIKRTVKAFNHFGAEQFRPHSRAQVFIAGDDAASKQMVKQLVQRLKFEHAPIDLGPARNAALMENLAVTWIHLATIGGQGRDFVLNLERV